MSIGWALAAARNMARQLRELDLAFSGISRYRRAPIPIGPPKSFACYRDPGERFEFGHPAEWKRREDGGIQVGSPRMGSFARVDVVPREADFWADLEKAVLLERGEFRVDAVRKGPPARARGGIRLAGLRFDWDGTAYRLGEVNVILTLGNVVDSHRSRTLETYEDKVLEAIRRSFRLGPGLRKSR